MAGVWATESWLGVNLPSVHFQQTITNLDRVIGRDGVNDHELNHASD
jgi:hypothetical protein